MRLKVLYHGNCFDGASSAALFTRFYRERVAEGPIDVSYASLEHKGTEPAIPPALLDGDVNACVDFRYTQDARLSWWFDHHASAFQQPGDEDHFRADRSGQKFYDPAAKSCARFLAATAAERFGFDVAPVAELMEWAEIIDGALFPTAQMPVELKEPALQLMTWIENNRNPALAEQFIADIARKPLAEVASYPWIAGPLGPILAQHRVNQEKVKKVLRVEKGVAILDLASEEIGPLNKFIVYYLAPEARYAVSVFSTGKRMKISVGSNPWSSVPRTHNIAAICEKYGGGGHPVVGAISLPKGDVDGAVRIAREVIETLKR
jgi:hypothetical protein